MYGAVGASISVREQRKKSISRLPRRPNITPSKSKKKVKVHPQPKTHATLSQADKLPNGKSAWGGGKTAGEKQKASEAHKRWVNVNKNKVQDDEVQSYHTDEDGGEERDFSDEGYEESESDGDYVDENLQDSESEEEEEIRDSGAEGPLGKSPDGRYRQTGVVNIVLYVGFGLITLGLIITFVGIGEHGFKSPELQLIGPSLIGCGVLFCLLRLFFCSVPACCKMCRKNKELDEKALLSPSRETLADETAPEAQNIPQPLQDEGKDLPSEPPVTSKSAHTIRSTIPNYIEDECEDDEALGLNVEYIDEASMRQRSRGSLSGSRPGSTQSRMSTASKVPRLPDIHTNGRGTGSELVLNPATLQSAGD